MRHLRVIFTVLLGSLVWPAAAQQWEAHLPMDQPRAGLAVAVFEDQIYLLGGQDQFGNVLDSAVRYNPETGQWFPLPRMNQARVGAAAAVFQGRIFVIGGLGPNGPNDVLNEVEFYDPNQNRWFSFANLNEKRQGLIAVANDTTIVVAGGSNEADLFLESIEFYNLSQQRWVTSAQLELTPRAALAAASVQENVFFLGGFGQSGPVDVVEQLGPGSALTVQTPLPTARGNLAATALGDSVYVIGGLDGTSRALADVHRFDLNANTWEPMPRLIIAREGCAAAAVGTALYVFGGRDATGRVLDSVESFGERALPTTTEDEEPPALLDFDLTAPYPNPFRTTTTITFSVSAAERAHPVELVVFDLLGRRVAVLVSGVLTPGTHTLTWDGTDRNGAPVGSGRYVLRLQQGALKAHKMTAISR